MICFNSPTPVIAAFLRPRAALGVALILLWFPALASAQNRVLWTTNYYTVTGATLTEIHQSIRENRPWKEKFDLDGANAAAHFEQRAADDALVFQKLGDALRRPIQPATAIATGLSVRSLLAKDPAVALR